MGSSERCDGVGGGGYVERVARLAGPVGSGILRLEREAATLPTHAARPELPGEATTKLPPPLSRCGALSTQKSPAANTDLPAPGVRDWVGGDVLAETPLYTPELWRTPHDRHWRVHAPPRWLAAPPERCKQLTLPAAAQATARSAKERRRIGRGPPRQRRRSATGQNGTPPPAAFPLLDGRDRQ